MSDPFRDADDRNRFELDVDGTTAFVTYRKSPGMITLVHTAVPPELASGRGLAQPFLDHTAHHSLSTFGRQRRILVSVHSVPLRITVCLATSAFTVGAEWTTS